jgi:hypothetical protein
MTTDHFLMLARRVGNQAHARYWLNVYCRDTPPWTAALSVLSDHRPGAETWADILRREGMVAEVRPHGWSDDDGNHRSGMWATWATVEWDVVATAAGG